MGRPRSTTKPGASLFDDLLPKRKKAPKTGKAPTKTEKEKEKERIAMSSFFMPRGNGPG
jgi:hypothetical protein